MIGTLNSKARCAFLLAVLIGLGNPAIAAESDETDLTDGTASVEAEVKAEATAQTDERRKKILGEAADALDRTRDALTALEENRVDDALNALALATGKLELIVARDPELALATTDVTMKTIDLLATPESIEAALEAARKAFEKGRIQKARHILDGLASEVVITVTSLPLATYPEAIKAITPLIDEGDIEAAKAGLETALGTLVLRDHIVPLPVLRAQEYLGRASDIVANEDRSDEDIAQLSENLAGVREQLDLAALLGYGDRAEYEDLQDQLETIEETVEDGELDESLFSDLQNALDEVWKRA